MKHACLCLIAAFLWCTPPVIAQISDDFSDGNFTENPAWQGDAGLFIVNANGELQLNAPDAGNAMLTVAGAIPDSVVWLLDVRLEFAPSTANLLRIYLLANQPAVLQANGYYLEIGENGTADALRLYRQDGAAKTLLLTGFPGFVANDPVNIRLRVKRSASGNWTLDAAGPGAAFETQGSASDATYVPGANLYFGFYCLYSATRKDKFFFDNLSILPDLPDTLAPVLLSAKALQATQVEVGFDEPLDSLTALAKQHYSISGVGQPGSVSFATSGRQKVLLQLSAPLQTGAYSLETNLVADLSGNVSGPQDIDFQYIDIQPADEFDIIINEIMAAPAPTVGLPETEWLELLNRSNKIIELNTLRLSDGGTPQTLPAHLLYPGDFVVLTSTSGAPVLAPVTAKVLPMPGFPGLNNDGDSLTLSTLSGITVDQVTYSADWQANTDKRAGGWSLERINPGLPCLGAENWQSCPVLPGGTPGKANAALQTGPDTSPPQVVAVFPESATRLRIYFSEGMDKQTELSPGVYRINPSRTIAVVAPEPTDRRQVVATLAEPLQPFTFYALSLTPALTDCSGNAGRSTDTTFFGLPGPPEPKDVVINEILFNPASGGSDFVELYNRGATIVSWQDMYLADFYGGSDVKAIGLKRLLLPGQYAVFTPYPSDIKQRFSGVQANDIFPRTLPSMPDDAGNITLYWAKDGVATVLDSFQYTAGYHNALLSSSDQEGVSLERIRPEAVTNDPANWTSAARNSQGDPGTPTRPNSQRPSAGDPLDGLIRIDPARLSPDDDGFEDYLDIQYRLPAQGFAVTMTIFDAGGIPVKRLVRQQLIGTEGALRWDGDLDDGTRARPGIYILFLELFSAEGNVQRVKKPFAVVQRF